MARYSELYMGDELTKLRDGLEILERIIDFDTLTELNIWLYAIVTDAFILDVAKEALADEINSSAYDGDADITESDIELSEIAVAIPITSTSSIDIIHGRGIRLRELSFAYQKGEGEGIRTASFVGAYTTSATIKADEMETQALASSEEELYDFLKDKGRNQAMNVSRKVKRNEEATKSAPVPDEPTPLEPPSQVQTPMPKQTSLVDASRLSAIVENFLG